MHPFGFVKLSLPAKGRGTGTIVGAAQLDLDPTTKLLSLKGAGTWLSGLSDVKTAKEGREEFRIAMRGLWEDHINFTRNYVISALADLPDADVVAQRLLKNKDDIGEAVRPYYGDEVSARLSSLLRDHITIAAEVVKAAKLGQTAELGVAQSKWTANGKDIAAFLARTIPSLSKAKLEAMLQRYHDFTTKGIESRLKKEWAADLRSYDDGHAYMMMFADTLAAGIGKHLSGRFKSGA